MQDDIILKVREEKFAEDFILHIKTKLELSELGHQETDIIEVWQYLDLNDFNLESYLFNKYGLDFLQYIYFLLNNL